MELEGIKKKIKKEKKYVKEKMGGEEGKKMDVELMEMERKKDVKVEIVEELKNKKKELIKKKKKEREKMEDVKGI
jgi:hypothetical protein